MGLPNDQPSILTVSEIDIGTARPPIAATYRFSHQGADFAMDLQGINYGQATSEAEYVIVTVVIQWG